MALQNTRSFLFRGEDLSFGGASPKELITPTTSVAQGRPILMSLGFYGSTTQLNNLLGAAALPMNGLNRFVVNRSPRFFMNLTVTLAAGNTGLTPTVINIPIAPLQLVFLPPNAYAPAGSQLAADSQWPLILAPNQTAGFLPPVAGTTTMLNVDFMQEQ